MEHHSGNYGPLGSGMNANANLGPLGASTAPAASNAMPNVAAANMSPLGAANMPPGGYKGTTLPAYAAGKSGAEILVLFILLVIILRMCGEYVRK